MKITLGMCLSALVCAADDGTTAQKPWNQFHGPNGDLKTHANLPTELSEAKNVRWKIPVPGDGWSSPVVWNQQVWMTTGNDKDNTLSAVCVDLETGKIIHNVVVFEVIDTPKNQAYAHRSPHLNSPASPTPVVEEGRVYVHFGTQGTACLDTKTGKKIWQRRDLHCDHVVRPGSSPIVDDNALYVAYDGVDNQFFVALDKHTGKNIWKKERNVQSDYAATLQARGIDPQKLKKSKPGDNKKSYATAQIIEVDGKRQLIAPAAEATIAYDPKTGDEFWRVHYPGGFNVAARPLFENGLVYIYTSGLTGHLLAVRPDGAGDVTQSHIAWTTTKSTPHIPSPIVVGDAMFLVTQRGIAVCLDATTGQQLWKQRIGGSHWASPLYANGKLYFFSKEGEVTVMEASKQEGKIVSKNRLDAELIASPAVHNDTMLLRSTSHLYCIAAGYERTPEQIAADTKRVRKQNKTVTPGKGKGKAELPADERLAKLGARLKELVKSGELSEEDAIELYTLAAGGK